MLVNVLVLNLLLLVPDGAHNVGEEVAVARVAGVAGRVLLGHPEDVILETSAAASAAAVVIVVVVVVAAAAAALVLMAVSRSAWERCTATACTNCWTVLLQSFVLDQKSLAWQKSYWHAALFLKASSSHRQLDGAGILPWWGSLSSGRGL